MSNNIKKLSYIFSIVLVLSYFLAVYFNNNVFNLKLNWDEIDYVEAASKEFSSIMLEKDTLNLKDFLKLSYLKLRKKENEIIQFSNSLIPEESDSFLLRHYHPTFPILFWSFFITYYNHFKITI